MVFFLVMLLTLMHIVYLTLKLTKGMETCEVTFDETMPCSSHVFECAGDQEIGENFFVEEDEEGVD